MSRKWVRRSGVRRSGIDRRQRQIKIYWPERRKAQRRSRSDRRAPADAAPTDELAAAARTDPEGRLDRDPKRLAETARGWLARLSR